MSQILFVATDPYIVALKDNLQQQVRDEIGLEADYTSGIKRIFDTHPAAVFMQHSIDKISCEKLANQVKMLLDGAVPLVLLSDEPATSYSVVSTYEACFDLCLPMEELTAQVLRFLQTLPGIAWKAQPQPAQEAAIEPTEDSTGPNQGAEDATKPLLQPAEDATNLPPQAAEQAQELLLQPAEESATLQWQQEVARVEQSAAHAKEDGSSEPAAPPVQPAVEKPPSPEGLPSFLDDFLDDGFIIEPIPDEQDEQQRQEVPAQPIPGDLPFSFKEFQRIEKEAPDQLFGSMSEAQVQPAVSPFGPVPPNHAGFTPPTSEPRVAIAKRQNTSASGGVAARGPESAHSPAEHADEIPYSVAAARGIRKKPRRPFIALGAGLLLVLLIVAAVDVFLTRRPTLPVNIAGIAFLDAALNAHKAAPVPGAPAVPATQATPAAQTTPVAPATQSAPGTPAAATQAKTSPASASAPGQLPLFIPQTSPDPNYGATHPGWERYRADGLAYLVYRENGDMRAVQVVCEERGAITAAFLKTCIRISSGEDRFQAGKTELRGGIEVERGTLQNGGELLVYRTVPRREIRGFVISFPGRTPASAQPPVRPPVTPASR